MSLVITRHFDAPRELVFETWTQKEHMDRWSAPKGFSIPFSEGDLRPGGAWRSSMLSPDGEELRLGGVYKEIKVPSFLSFTHAWEEEQGNSPETLVEVTLTDDGDGGTDMEFKQDGFRSKESEEGHKGGWTECFELLDAYLEDLKLRELVLTRFIEVAPEVVFNAWTHSAQLAEWWGPHGFSSPVCEIDPTPGGLIHIDMCAPDGTVYPMSGVCREVDAPHTFVFLAAPLGADGTPLFEMLDSIHIGLAPGGSLLTVRAVLQGEVTPQSAPFLAGMQEGWRQTLERLTTFLSR